MFNFKKTKKINRQELVTILDEFKNNYKKYKIFEVPDELYIECLTRLENELNLVDPIYDKRFVTYGRLDFLRKELSERLNDKELSEPDPNIKNKWDNRLGAFWDLYDFIIGDRNIPNSEITKNNLSKDIILLNDNYYEDGFICLEEKNIILEMIKEMKEFINNKKELHNKYDIDPVDNAPREVYGIPDMDLYLNKKKEVFKAFEGGYSGPSEYFYIDYVNGMYEFKSGYSKDGRLIPNISNNIRLDVSIKNEDYYNSFKNEMMQIIKNWESNYHNNNVYDGTQWNVLFILENENHSGSNEFPENYDEMKKVLSKYFKNKYDIDPVDNAPQVVYGIPDFFEKEENYNKINYEGEYSSYIGRKVSIDLENSKSKKYTMTLYRINDKTAELTFANMKKLDDNESLDISMELYNKFIDRLNEITKNWNDKYEPNGKQVLDIEWGIYMSGDDNSREITGHGAVPEDWNKFMDLITEYELLFKEKNNTEYNTFERIVKKQFNDPFWAELVIRYFRDELKENDTTSKNLFEDIMKYDDILNEFTKYLIQKNYDFDNPVVIKGYTAKKIAEKNQSFDASMVYSSMKTLRDDPDNALKIIEKSILESIFPPDFLEKTKDDELADKYLKEIKDEVDQELIDQNLMFINEKGEKIPAFGSCHIRWGIEKRILKERYNIDWLTPQERNPYTKFD